MQQQQRKQRQQPAAQGQGWSVATTGGASRPAPASPQSSSSGGSSSAFGGDQMSGSFNAWCAQQLKVLVGNADLTLVQFCMTLTDQSEIREYLRTYLVGVSFALLVSPFHAPRAHPLTPMFHLFARY